MKAATGILASILWASASALSAQETGHLAEMPTVQRVIQDMQGQTVRDTVARQVAAFQLLDSLAVRDIRNPTPQEEARRAEYRKAHEAIRQEEIAKYDPQCRLSNDCDFNKLGRCQTYYYFSPGFVRGLVDRYFSTAWQAQYLSTREGNLWKNAMAIPAGSPEPQLSGDMARACNDGSAQQKAQLASVAGVGKASTATGTTAQPGDRGNKAARTGVDMTVFGIPLGVPLTLPKCTRSGGGVCQDRPGILGSLMGADVSISLPGERCPRAWFSVGALCSMVGELVNDELASVLLLTQGKNVEDMVGEILRQKYGKPSKVETVSFQNKLGAKWSVENLEWNLPGLHVEFKPVGQLGDLDSGFVIIETSVGERVRKGRLDDQKAKQPKL